jgi:hypothetical protein
VQQQQSGSKPAGLCDTQICQYPSLLLLLLVAAVVAVVLLLLLLLQVPLVAAAAPGQACQSSGTWQH